MVIMSIDTKYEVTAEKELSCLSNEKQRIVIDLLTQLATVLNEKSTIEQENSGLKSEKHRLIQRYLDLERDIKSEKKTWMKDVIDSQMKVQEKETIIAKKDVERLEEQKTSLLEINNLKLSFYEQNARYKARELTLITIIKELKNEIDFVKSQCNDLKSNAELNYSKCSVYKNKVKVAVSAINELMQEVKKYKKPLPKMTHEACQTDTFNESAVDKTFNFDPRNHLCQVCLLSKEYNCITQK